MRPFRYQRASDSRDAIKAFQAALASGEPSYVAGGTTLIDLMKLDVMRPATVVDLSRLGDTPLGRIEADDEGLRLGALVPMAAAADHPRILRDYPVIAQSLQLAASAQLRNMASLGGNVLQRTRCTYFRDISYPNCNKRAPGSGCAAMDGVNRQHAVLGTSPHCIASYPGDFAQALIALDAEVDIAGDGASRKMPFAKLHRRPGDTPQTETTLTLGELITGFTIPAAPWTRRSLYLKVRDRASYEFALASAAVALDLQDGAVRQARIALGGVSTLPWRSHAAEQVLRDRPLDDKTLQAAADAAFADAQPRQHNRFKIALGKNTLVRALQQTAALEL